ncbi:hypothetical protein Hanom_Chr08g00747941 [Helianthus anomalus]
MSPNDKLSKKKIATATTRFPLIKSMLFVIALIPYELSRTETTLASCQITVIYTNPIKYTIKTTYKIRALTTLLGKITKHITMTDAAKKL